MTQIPPNNIFLSEQILQKSESEVGSEFVHPTCDSLSYLFFDTKITPVSPLCRMWGVTK